jgi:hypothetical protein
MEDAYGYEDCDYDLEDDLHHDDRGIRIGEEEESK